MEHTLKYNGVQIAYNIAGNGSAVVLLHGFTETKEIWNDFSAELSGEYKVLTIDLPGHGLSGCLGEVHTMELMADCIKSVIDQVGIKESVMVGHSMGGYVTLAFAEKYPEIIKGFGMFHSSALADSEEAKVNRDRTINLIRQNHTSFISLFIPDLFAEHNREKYKEEISQMVDAANNMSPDSIIAAQEGMKIRKDRLHVLTDARCPVLFILGKLDSRVPYDKALRQVALTNDAVLLSMGDVAHMGYIEARDKTLYAVRTFLQGVY